MDEHHQTRRDPAINVRQLGAVGDGHTDDTAAVQAAVDAAAGQGGLVIFPPGVYACSTIRLRPHVTLRGCASWTYWYFQGSVLQLIDEGAEALLDASGAHGVVIDGLACDGQQIGRGVHGVMVRSQPFPHVDQHGAFDDTIRIERSLVRNFSGDGVHLDGICVFTVRHSMIANNQGDGVWVHGYDGYILDCWLTANRRAGYGGRRLNASVTLTANRIEWNGEGGIVIAGGNGYNITGNLIDRSGGPGIALGPAGDEPCHTITMTGNIIRRSGAQHAQIGPHASSHIALDTCRGVVCSGNTLSVGQDDGGQGEFTPAFGVVYRNLRECVISGNTLHQGALEQLLVDQGGNHAETLVIRDNVGSLMARTAAPRPASPT